MKISKTLPESGQLPTLLQLIFHTINWVDKGNLPCAALPVNGQRVITKSIANQGCIFDASTVYIDVIQYQPGMVISTDSCSSFPEFVQIFKVI